MLSREQAIDAASKIQGWMSFDELRWLYDTCKGKIVIEIGIWKGRSTFAIASSASDVYALDTWEDGTIECHRCECTASQARHEALENLLGFCSIAIAQHRDIYEHLLVESDVLFIDGDHSYDAVVNDLQLDRFIVDGGIVSGHDRDLPGVQLAIAERYGVDRLRTGPGSIWWVKK